jgi:hypothetical protein
MKLKTARRRRRRRRSRTGWEQQIRKHVTWKEEVGKKLRKMGSGNTETNEGRV